MRLDPQSAIGGKPALRVRKFLQKVSDAPSWDSAVVQAAFSVNEDEARTLIHAFRQGGLIQRVRAKGKEAWTVSQSGQSFAIAKATRPITRKTAEIALGQFMERVQRVNREDYFLAKVTRIILFGSILQPDVDRLGDVDIAIQLEAKEHTVEIYRQQNARRVAECERNGQRIIGILKRSFWWQIETFRFLKGRNRSISLHDYQVDRELIDLGPHKWLMGEPGKDEKRATDTLPRSQLRKKRKPRDCPF